MRPAAGFHTYSPVGVSERGLMKPSPQLARAIDCLPGVSMDSWLKTHLTLLLRRRSERSDGS
jgi:hypothetical protein